MEPNIFSSFSDELLKIAELNDKERQELKDAIRRQAKYDQRAGAGELGPDSERKMRANVDRIKAYRAKSKGEARSIPRWARNPSGAPPSARSWGGFGGGGRAPGGGGGGGWPGEGRQSPFGGPMGRSAKQVAASAAVYAALGAGLGAGAGALSDAFMTKKQKEKEKERVGPIGRWALDHPVAYNSAMSAVTLPLLFTPGNLPIGVLASFLPGIVVSSIDSKMHKKEKAEAKKRGKRSRVSKAA